MSLRRHSAKVLKATVGKFIVAMATDLWSNLIYNTKEACCAVNAMPEIHTREKFDFLKCFIHSQII